jgi:tripartite-type tricarboxylate transporter receptor subunit TctC
MERNRRLFFSIVFFSIVFSSMLMTRSHTGAAEKFPGREVQLVTANPAGGFVDIAVRLMSDNLSKELGVPVVVSNRAGSGGAAGTTYLVKSKPDGYTFGSISSADVVLLPALISTVPFKHSDLDPLCKYASSTTVIFCRSQAPWKNVEELVADAKKRPGQITYGATTHSVSHLQMESFAKAAGISMMHVPLRAAGETITRVLGGNLDIGIVSMAPAVGQVKAGELRALFLIAPERVSAFPQIPLLKEKGYSDPVLTLYNGFYAPLGIPAPARETLTKALEKVIKDPALKKKLEDVSLALEYLPSKAFGEEIEGDVRRVTQFVKAAGFVK